MVEPFFVARAAANRGWPCRAHRSPPEPRSPDAPPRLRVAAVKAVFSAHSHPTRPQADHLPHEGARFIG
jgi:hypothetical protein